MSIALLVLQATLAVALGAVFVASSIPKLRHPRGFVLAVMEYRVLPIRASWIVGRMLPPLELLVGLLLVSGVLLPVAAGAAVAMTLCFLLAIGVNLARGRDLDCHCFGSHRRSIGWRVIVEDTDLLLASALLMGTSVESGQGNMLAVWSPWRLVWLTDLPARSAIVAAAALAAAVLVIALVLNPRSVLHHTSAASAK